MTLPHRLGGSVSTWRRASLADRAVVTGAPCCVEQLRDQRQSIGIVVNGQDVNRLLIPC
jgi:hypothetical protein